MAETKRKKLDRDSAQYRREEINLALSFVPPIYPCRHCGHPVIEGYCCGTCGSSDPR